MFFLRCLNYIERELLQLLKFPPSLFSQCRRSISRNRLIYHSYSILPKIMFNSLFNQDMSTELQLVPVFQLRTTLKTWLFWKKVFIDSSYNICFSKKGSYMMESQYESSFLLFIEIGDRIGDSYILGVRPSCSSLR